MKSRWWIATFLLVTCGLLFQSGCGTKEAALPMEAEPDAEVEDPAADVEVPSPDDE